MVRLGEVAQTRSNPYELHLIKITHTLWVYVIFFLGGEGSSLNSSICISALVLVVPRKTPKYTIYSSDILASIVDSARGSRL